MLLPRIVYLACVHGGLIVGSQAKRLAGEAIKSDTSDWDLLIPFEKWSTIALMIPEDARPNKFGGWRFEDIEGNYICEVRYGGASANTLQRGFWTHTKNALRFFRSVTGGWVDYSHNSVSSHSVALSIINDDLEWIRLGEIS